MAYPYAALATVLILFVYFWTFLAVGAARGKFKVPAPATTGHPDFERVLRVQANTLEQLAITLPALWLFAISLDDRIAGVLGLVFVIGRILYGLGYRAAAEKRGSGFLVGGIATLLLVLGSAVGVVWKGFLS
jgi:glutathione S-transferase